MNFSFDLQLIKIDSSYESFVLTLSMYFEILRFEEIYFDKISCTLVNNVNIKSIMIIYKNYTPCMAVHVIE